MKRILAPVAIVAFACPLRYAAAQGVSSIPAARMGPPEPTVAAYGLNYDPQHLALGWIPSGRELLVAHRENYSAHDVRSHGCAESGIFSVPIDGGESRLVAHGTAVCSALHGYHGVALHPAGDRIAYIARPLVNNNRFSVLNLLTGQLREVPVPCDGVWGVLDPGAWSPRGDRLAVVAACEHPEDHSRIYLVSSDGHGVRRLAPVTTWEETEPAWAPDGSRIAFTQYRGTWRRDRHSIAVMDTLGRGRRVLAPGWGPAWSPNGEWIAFFSSEHLDKHAPTNTIRVIRVDGRDEREVFRTAEKSTMARGWGSFLEGQPRGPLLWSPDGRWLVFGREFNGGTTIWRLRLEDGHLDQVSAVRRDTSNSGSR